MRATDHDLSRPLVRRLPDSPSVAIGSAARRRAERIGWVVAGLMALSASLGILVGNTYQDNMLVRAAWRGTDLVTLGLAVPVMIAAAWLSRRGSLRARPVLSGLFLYAAYNYAFYLFGAAFNALFPVYVAIVALSTVGLVIEIPRGLREHPVTPRRAPRLRGVALFMAGVGVLLGTFWLAQWIGFLATGRPPAMVEATAHPTNVTGALDLLIVVPLALTGSVWLWRLESRGMLVATIWCVKGAIYMIALCSASVVAYRSGAVEELTQIALWGPLGAGCLLSIALLLQGTRRPPELAG